MTEVPDQLRQQMRQIVADDCGVDIEDVADDARLEADIGMDSLDFVEVIMAFEEAYDIQPTEGDSYEPEFEDCETFGQLLEYLARRLPNGTVQ